MDLVGINFSKFQSYAKSETSTGDNCNCEKA